ncbi:MAG TPA: hypothetical protein VMU15_01935 [Anaeromyxobacter sp.]|nr:hypothetical protein [Anaeromyxobacter sp.]
MSQAVPGGARSILARTRGGGALVLRAAALVARDRGLRRAVALPTLLTCLGCAALAAFLAWVLDQEDTTTLGRLHQFMTAFVALSSMPPTLLTRQWTRVALEARRALGLGPGEDSQAGRSYARALAGEWAKAVRQALVVGLGLSPLLLLLWVAPDGTWEVLGVAWAFYWVIVDALELPIEVVPGPPPPAPVPWFTRGLARVGRTTVLVRPAAWAGGLAGRLSRPWAEEIHFTERRPWECLGFGLAAGALLAIPGLGLLFRAVVITGATSMLAGAGEAEEPAAPGQAA